MSRSWEYGRSDREVVADRINDLVRDTQFKISDWDGICTMTSGGQRRPLEELVADVRIEGSVIVLQERVYRDEQTGVIVCGHSYLHPADEVHRIADRLQPPLQDLMLSAVVTPDIGLTSDEIETARPLTYDVRLPLSTTGEGLRVWEDMVPDIDATVALIYTQHSAEGMSPDDL